MKVAMVTTVGERCGIASYTRALVGGLCSLPEVQVEIIPIREGRQPKQHYIEQAERLNAYEVDVVHIQHEFSFWGGVLPESLLRPQAGAFWELRYLIKKPVVLTAHTTYTLAEMLRIKSERRPHKWLAKQWLLHNKGYRDSVESAPFTTSMTIVHTEAARQEMIRRGAKPGFVVTIPSGVPEPLPAPTEGQAFRQKFGLEGRRLVTIFGYTAPNKGYELTLEILPSLPEDVTLVIAGGARNADMETYAAQLQQAIARSGQARRVVVTGFLAETDVAEAMAASEVVLVPHTEATGSYSVTFPITYGKPILASDLDCFTEIQSRVDCLELFQAGDAEDYTNKLKALLASGERREKLAAGARKYAARFAWPKVAAKTVTVYQAAIEVFGDLPRKLDYTNGV